MDQSEGSGDLGAGEDQDDLGAGEGRDEPGAGEGRDEPGAGEGQDGEGQDEPGAGETDDALRRLEQRLDRASDAAERLLAEAASTAARAARSAAGSPHGEPPPAGWQVPTGEDAQPAGAEVELLTQVLRSLRDLIPPELQRRIAEALRDLLLAIRALIDWYLERVDRTRPTPSEVQDIPIA